MTARRILRGTELRYVLTLQLARHGPATVPELVNALTADGFTVQGRPSKTVSDALRWEIGRGRVWRIGRGRYRFAEMPRGTEYRILQRVEALRAEARELLPQGALSGNPSSVPGSQRQPSPRAQAAGELSLRGGQHPYPSGARAGDRRGYDGANCSARALRLSAR